MARMARNQNSRARDMIISMAVILVPILVLVFVFTQPSEQKAERADVAGMLERATTESPYPLLVAEGLGDDWTPTRVAWAKDGTPFITSKPADGNSWQVGYLSPEAIYYGVQQRDRGAAAFVSSVTREGKDMGGGVEAAGRTWTRYESKDGRTRSLVSESGDVTSIVTADTDFVKLEAFAGTLAEVAPRP